MLNVAKKIKYLENVWIPNGAIIIDDTVCSNCERFITHSMSDMINYLRDKYLPYRRRLQMRCIKLSIYNLNAIMIPPVMTMTYTESKDILCKYAYRRVITISPDLKEVYCEVFSLNHDETRKTGFVCCYDYGILYGRDIPIFEDGSIVESSYIPKEDLVIQNYNRDCITIRDKQYTVGRDLFMFNRVFWNDESNEYPMNDCEDGCVPISTIKLKE